MAQIPDGYELADDTPQASGPKIPDGYEAVPNSAPGVDSLGIPMMGHGSADTSEVDKTREQQFGDNISGLDPQNDAMLRSIPLVGDLAAGIGNLGAKALEAIPAGMQYGADKIDDATGLPIANTALDILNGTMGEGSLHAPMELGKAAIGLGDVRGAGGHVDTEALQSALDQHQTADEIASQFPGIDRARLDAVVKARDAGKAYAAVDRDASAAGQAQVADEFPEHPSTTPQSSFQEQVPGAEGPSLDSTFKEVPEGYEPAPDASSGAPEQTSSPTARSAAEAHAQRLTDHINTILPDWKNAPDVEVLPEGTKDIADPATRQAAAAEGADADALGFQGPDGKVRIFAHNIKDIPAVVDEAGETIHPAVSAEDQVQAILYHEALGHHGLSSLLGDSLDSTLTDFYKNSTGGFKDDVDAWIKRNPNQYKGPNQLARAAEEVLAEKSERGAIPPSLMNRVKLRIAQFGRKAGLKTGYSDGQIHTILSMAHDATINGKDSAVANGFKFARSPRVYHNDDYGHDEGITFKNGKEADVRIYGNRDIRDMFDDLHSNKDSTVKDISPSDAEALKAKGQYMDARKDLETGGDKRYDDPKQGLPGDDEIKNIHPDDSTALKAASDYFRGQKELEDSGIKFSKKKSSDADREIAERVSNTAAKVSTVADFDSLVADIRGKSTAVPQSWGDLETQQRALGMTPSKAAARGSIVGTAAKVDAVRHALANTVDRTNELTNKLSENYNEADAANLIKSIANMKGVFQIAEGNATEAGRTLASLRRIVTSNRKASEILKAMQDLPGGIGDLAKNPDLLMKFAKQLQAMGQNGNIAGAGTLINKLNKPYWEDYFLTGRHAAMLSGLSTHFKNAKDNAGLMVNDLASAGLAMAGGNMSKAEFAGRITGVFDAAIDTRAHMELIKDLLNHDRIKTRNQAAGTKVQFEHARIPAGPNIKGYGLGSLVNKPLDALEAGDHLFRSLNDRMTLTGLGVREAEKQGYTGIQAIQRGRHIALNPTDEMVAETKKVTNRNLLVDAPSPFTAGIDRMKARTPNMSGGARTMRAVAHVIFPFVRVADRTLARQFQRSPLGFLPSLNGPLADALKTGDKAARDTAIAKATLGTAVLAYYVSKSLHPDQDGSIQGDNNDYKKVNALQAGGYLPNSVKADGKYTDATAVSVDLNPFGLSNSSATQVATLTQQAVKAYKAGGSASDYLAGLNTAAASIVAGNSFANAAAPALDALNDQAGGGTSGKAAAYGAGIARSFVPNVVNQTNQQFFDTTKHDSSGEHGLVAKTKQAVEAALPVLSDKLPTKFDNYGRPMEQGKSFTGLFNSQDIDNDPTVAELHRLESTTDKVVVDSVPTHVKIDGVDTKLSSQQHSDFQRVAGTYLLKSMEKIVSNPQYQSASDTDKIDLVKDLKSSTRKEVREAMFPDKDSQ